jgi:hypothetical protein
MSADNLKAMSAYLLGTYGKSAKIAAAFVALLGTEPPLTAC